MMCAKTDFRPPLLFVNSIKFWGGGEQWFLQSAAALAERGYDVCVAGRSDGVFLDRIRDMGLPTLPLGMASDFAIRDYSRLRRWLSEHSRACVLCNLSRDIRIAGAAARSLRGNRVWWIMGSILIRNRLRDRFWTRTFVDRFVVPSHALGAELVSLGYIDADRVKVLPIGLNIERWTESSKATPAQPDPGEDADARPTVGVFGRLETRKGHAILLEAWPIIRNRVPTAQLLIVGTGQEKESLKQLAQPYGESVRFLGHINDIPPIMRAVDVVVQPSLYEPFGITLLEGMACAKPIVCTNVGGMPEVVDSHSAVIVPPDDPVRLGDAVSELLANPEKSAAMGAAGRRRVEEHFSLDLMIDRLEGLIAGGGVVSAPGASR